MFSKFIGCYCFVVACLLLSPMQVVAQDTTQTHPSLADTIKESSKASPGANIPLQQTDDEFNIFLLVFGMAAISFMIGSFLLGLIIFLLLLLMLVLFVTMGLVSTSVFIGLYKRSFSSGFKVLLITGGSFAGLICGLVGFGLISYLFNLDLEQRTITIAGSIGGVIAGALLGLIIFKILRRTLTYLKTRLQL